MSCSRILNSIKGFKLNQLQWSNITVVSSLTGDALDVFHWILSPNPGNTQDLSTLLQMLREHYCGSLTFREERNTIENLCQRPQEAAIDFLIRVSTSMSNLGKDWKDELMEKELQSLQYECKRPFSNYANSFFFFVWLFAGFLVPLVSEACAGLGNGCERFCALRSLLGSYVHQKSI